MTALSYSLGLELLTNLINEHKYHLYYFNSEEKTEGEGDKDHQEGEEGDQAGTYTWIICHRTCGKNCCFTERIFWAKDRQIMTKSPRFEDDIRVTKLQ